MYVDSNVFAKYSAGLVLGYPLIILLFIEDRSPNSASVYFVSQAEQS